MAFSMTALTPIVSIAGNAIPSGSINATGYNALVIAVFWGPGTSPSAITALSVNSVVATQLSGAIFDNSANSDCSDIWFIPSGPNGSLSIAISTALTNGIFIAPYGIIGGTVTQGYSNGIFSAAGITVSGIITPSGGGLIGFSSDLDTNTIGFDHLTTDNVITYQGQFGPIKGAAGSTITAGITSVATTTAPASNGPYVMSIASITPSGGIVASNLTGIASAEW